MIGRTVGSYRVLDKLGEGGMGEVYRARDVRLGRDVAVKALSAASRLDADRVVRFEREAQILASLNHPNIAAIYGIEDSPPAPGEPGPSQFLILELVGGGTLADRIGRGRIELAELLPIARQVADALHAAHDKGIIHRDLKPGNIALTPDGQPKVLDFGLAKAAAPGADAPTAPIHATDSGVVLGTAAYMSPEQLRGQALDKRTDIWSFGCLVFEALSGRHPFAAASLSDMTAAILGRDPDWSCLPAATPARVVWLLRRCLEKDVRRRLHDIADARIEIDDAIADSGGMAPASGAESAAPRGRIGTREAAAWLAAAVAVVAAVASWWIIGSSASGQPAAMQVSILLPRGVRLPASEDPSARFALSPDGRRLVVVGIESGGETRLWLRPLDAPVAQPLAGTEGATHPFWSPDSKSVAFVWRPLGQGITSGPSKLKRIDLSSGHVATIADARLAATGTWNRDGVILFTPSGTSSIQRVSASGGSASAATTLDTASGEGQHVNPFFLPDGRHFLFSAIGSPRGATDPRGVFVGSLDAAEKAVMLFEGGTNAKFSDGHLVFVRDARLMAQPFDLAQMRLQSGTSPVPLAEGVQNAGGSGGGSTAAFSVSETGAIAFQSTEPVPMQLEWFDRSGKRVGVLGAQGDYGDLVLSPDGSRVAVSLLDPAAGQRDIWTLDVKRGVRNRITSNAADDFAPVWSPAGDRLVFSSVRQGRIDLYETSADGGGAETPIPVPGLDVGKYAAHWSADDQWLAFVAGGRVISRSDVWILPRAGGGKGTAVLESSSVETQPRFSPDSAWLMYSANDPGRLEVYVRPVSGSGRRQQVSTDGGDHALWRKDGTEIFFLSPDNQIMVATVRKQGTEPQVGTARPLFRINYRRVRLDAYPYAVSLDGQQILVNSLVEDAATPISLLVNWRAAVSR